MARLRDNLAVYGKKEHKEGWRKATRQQKSEWMDEWLQTGNFDHISTAKVEKKTAEEKEVRRGRFKSEQKIREYYGWVKADQDTWEYAAGMTKMVMDRYTHSHRPV